MIGQTAPFSGLQAEYGSRLAAGLLVAFEEANVGGGVQARNLTLFSLDDGYHANSSLVNFLALENQTLLLAGVCGSAINAALLPLVEGAGMPNVGPWTGAAVTRVPFRELVINVRPSMTDEMVVHAILLVQKLRVHRIACFYQNDVFGLTALSGITAALSHVGLQLVVTAPYTSGSTDIEAALTAIAGQSPPVQAVVMASLEAQSVEFLRRFRGDPRTDPNCAFLFTSGGVTAAFASKVEPRYWANLYFTHIVPPLNTPGLPIVAQFRTAAALYRPANLTVDHMMFEGYLDGRLIAEVLKGIPGEVTRQTFLDELYNTRLYALGGLLAGLYSRNFSGCDRVVCDSNIGLRSVFPATLDPATGEMSYNASLGSYSYPVTELSFPVTGVVRPLLFGQLLPTDDPVWRRVAEVIGQQLQGAFAALNAAGGVEGRPAQLIQQWYSGDPAPQAAALTDRYAPLALVGSVVEQSSSLAASAAAQIGTYQTAPPATYAAFNPAEVSVQASLPLELMALAAFACKLGQPVHLRAPATAAGQAALQAMVQSLHSLQQQPASSLAFGSAADALRGLSAGTVIAVGSNADVQAWFLALAALPQLRLLVPSPGVLHLRTSLNLTDYPQSSRLHYPSMFGTGSAVSGAGPLDAALYGRLLGALLTAVLDKAGNASLAYTTTEEVLSALYGSQYNLNGVTLGPYYAASCAGDPAAAGCECSEGVRQITVLATTGSAQPGTLAYGLSACRVAYADLIVAPEAGLWYVGVIVGVGGGGVVAGLLGWWLVRRGQRDNSAAPKSGKEPFCIIFTDIQASTYLWATVPDVMAGALHVHHTLIRRLLAKHRLYEVKTIGDSFMCATRSPRQAVEFGLHLQRELFACDWGTDRIDTAYLLQQHGEKGKWSGSHGGWNGLRVRVGIHYGQGEVYLDPVSKGYDYYGTVVNTAARVEAVCHGGQVCVTQAVYDAMKGEFPEADILDLGGHVLRGLTEPVHLYQLMPPELSARAFPPLRLEYAATVEVSKRPPTDLSGAAPHARAAVVPVGDMGASVNSVAASQSASAAQSASLTAATWVEYHPMVRSGQLTPEDLAVRYCTVLTALGTLLETQTQRVRESSLRAYCERLHVRYSGCEGGCLEETLAGVVQRVLPAALSAVGRHPQVPHRGPSSAQLRRRSGSLEVSTPVSHRHVTAELQPV
eukprot:EG_transcript_574